ncbi:histidine phosphatase family protein [Thalassovita taeanensis]|uniref:Broad specificity phosphatase PhoE n=1 Tax=Thalassovita taeanensis TaxID=657014 RepID=A0A1H9DD81_9RHOB|nr:histidine phosphatase family protein [Thalassovita taeanensis]SEQ11522.1 Broad specificity phosphatase PhoE [Thalassovita taeanensis]
MSRFFWVRHGPTHAKTMVGWSDLPADLSDTAQLSRLNAHLPPEALVISSDLSRAAATADSIVGPRTRLPHDPDLREIHFGAWELQRFSDVEDQAHIRTYWENPGDVRPPGGESWHDVVARVDRAVARLIAAHPGRDIVAVAHFGVILTQVQQALQIGAYEAFSHKIENLSVTELTLGAEGWRAGRINHLP